MPEADTHVPDHVLLLANQDYSFSLRRLNRTPSTEVWQLWNGGERIGLLTLIQDERHYWHVYASITVQVDPENFTDYVVAFLDTLNIDSAFITGLGTIPVDEFINGVPISALRLRRAQAIQDRCFTVLQVR